MVGQWLAYGWPMVDQWLANGLPICHQSEGGGTVERTPNGLVSPCTGHAQDTPQGGWARWVRIHEFGLAKTILKNDFENDFG